MRTTVLASLALLAFAGNSLLCRLALADEQIDPGSFTLVRLTAGALLLTGYLWRDRPFSREHFSGPSALALFIYAAAFSFAYLSLTAGTGALLLFGAVQLTMITWGIARGDRLTPLQWLGLTLAIAGVVLLLLPGWSSPSPVSAALMISAGIAWGSYSLLGKRARHPVHATASNFIWAVPLAALTWLLALASGLGPMHASALGILYAITSGALTSGLGYVIWYTVLPALRPTTAATIQLTVPLLTTLAAIALLGEPFTLKLLAPMIAILGGVGLVIRYRKV